MALNSDPRHEQIRGLLRWIGPAILLTGIVLVGIGLASFFMAFGSFEPPRYFWCAFLGGPLCALGMGVCKFAYMGSVIRFLANEVAPVQKDAINYMVGGTKSAMRDMAQAVSSGLNAGFTGAPETTQTCPQCHSANELDAKFCRECGRGLHAEQACASCGAEIAANARFCDQCGTATSR